MIVKRDAAKQGRGPAAEAPPTIIGSPAVDPDALGRGLAATRRWLLDQQRDDGHWVGELEGDTILESEFVLMLASLGREDDEVAVKLCKYLFEQRLPEGGWAVYPGGPFDLSVSVEAYFALKLVGVHADHPEMARVRDRILAEGGAQACNSFTRFYLALLGQISYDDCPYVPPELVLMPISPLRLSIYDMSSWTRSMVVPLSILSVLRPVRHLPPEKGIAELFRPDLPMPSRRTERTCTWSNFFLAVDRVFKWGHRLVPRALRRPGLAAAHRWMVRHFEGSEGLGAIFPAMVYSVFALRALGYDDDHPLVVRAMAQLEDLMIEENGNVRVQPCVSPTWDTAIAAIALADSGLPADDLAMNRAARWLLDQEIRVPGDWERRRPGLEPTGWAFEYRNDFYPDIDDTAMVLLAIGRTALADSPEGRAVTERAVAWLLAMQGRDGGWAAFDVDIDNQLLNQVPFADHNAILDPSCADITARILEILGTLGYREDHPAVSRGLQYLWATQEPEGCWYGRWGVNYIYGTWQVLLGLRAIDFPMDHPAVRRAADWLESVQQEDGGWGESCRSYDDPAWMGRGVTTASQTAWAVNGLIAAGRPHSPAVRRGVSFLLRTQNPDGTWDEPQFTGTGFPKVFYLRYHLYRIYFPLMALSRYRAALSGTDPLTPRVSRALHSGALACGIPADPRPLDV